MQEHKVHDADGAEFTIHVEVDGRIARIDGPWPQGGDAMFELTGDLPRVRAADNVPDHLISAAGTEGLSVCYYDDVHCQTCYCDGSGKVVRCVRHC